MKPETVNASVTQSAKLLGVDRTALILASAQAPQILYQKPETLNTNATTSARLLGISKEEFTSAGLKQAQLLYLKPETLDNNARTSARLLDLTKREFIEVCLRHPQVFFSKPETLAAKKEYIVAISSAIGSARSFLELFQKSPAMLNYSRQHLHARYVVAKNGLTNCGLGRLLVLPSKGLEALLHDHFARKIAATGKGRRALQVMHASAMIKTLPDGIEPISRPPAGRFRAVSGGENCVVD
jgi:hypothetical protein